MIKSSNFTLYKSRYSELPDSIVDNERKIAEAFLTTEVVKSVELTTSVVKKASAIRSC